MNSRKCIISKILNICIILLSISFIPSQIYIGIDITIVSLISSIVISCVIFSVGWMGLLQTNDPLNRYNPLTINKRWRDKMNSSVSENPFQIFQLDQPDIDDLRDDKIKKILK